MEIKEYKISNVAVRVITDDDEINIIPMMHVQDVSYSKDSVTVNFSMISLNTKNLKFNNKNTAKAFHDEISSLWYNL